MAEKGRPGVMLWFDLRPCLKRLNLEEKGRLFECILDYAEYGAVPELEGMTGVAWDFIQPRIDRDAERYAEVSERRRQAAYKRWDRQEKEVPTDANAYFALQTVPTATTSPTTKTTSTPSPTATAAFALAAKPRAAGRPAPDLQAAAEEMSFEDLRQQKLKMLSGMMGAGL